MSIRYDPRTGGMVRTQPSPDARNLAREFVDAISQQPSSPGEDRWVNFYPPCDDTSGNHPWRTTSWKTEALARQHANQGLLATVRVTLPPRIRTEHGRAEDRQKTWSQMTPAEQAVHIRAAGVAISRLRL
jgi:hypothetical protein